MEVVDIIKLYFSMFFSFTTEIIVAVIMFMPKRLKFRNLAPLRIVLGFLISYGVSIAMLFLVINTQWNVWINILIYVVMIIAIVLSFWLVYDMKFNEIIIVSSVAYGIQHIAYQACVLILDTGLKKEMYSIMSPENVNLVYNLVIYAVRIIVYVGAFFTLVKIFRKNAKFILNTWLMIIIAAYVVLFLIIVNAFVSNYIFYWQKEMKGIMAAVMLTLTVLLEILVIGIYKFVEGKQNLLLIESTLENNVQQHEMTEQNINFINMKCHDLRKIVRKLKQKKNEITDEDLDQIEEALRLYDVGVKTGNQSLDVLIQDKMLYCKSRNIELTTLINGKVFENFDQGNTYSLFMNIIDNAIEAVERLDDPQKKVISIVASDYKGAILIEETNYFKGKINIRNNGTIETTNKDKKFHGFGTKSIAYIVNKYNGKVLYSTEEDVFKLKIVF